MQVRSLVGKIPWRRAWQLPPAFLPGESHGQRSLAGYSPEGHKKTQLKWLSSSSSIISTSYPIIQPRPLSLLQLSESQYLSTWGLGVGEAGTCCKPPNKTQDHQIKLLKYRRSKNQERLTQICLDSLRRWTGPKGLCGYQNCGSS